MSDPVIIGDCTLYLGDANEILPTLADNFETTGLLTDPPYGIGESNERALSRGKLAKPKDYGHFDWDKEPPSKALLSSCRIRAKHQIIFGGNYFELPPTKCWLIWDKLNGGNDFADCELAWTNIDMAVRRIRWLWNGMIRKGQEERYHPTQKPLGVIKWALDFFPDEVTTVLDPFMGSGTTIVACAKKGIKGIGIEREPKYFDIACKRIEDAYRQPDFFVAAPVKVKQDSFI